MHGEKKVAAIIQARMDSTRLPGKVMRTVCGKVVLWHVLNRAKQIGGIDQVIVATVDSPKEDPIRALCNEMNVEVFSGSKDDVLQRYYLAAREYKASTIIRITSDCPLIDPEQGGELLNEFNKNRPDYMANNLSPSFPHGLDMEIMTFDSLAKSNSEAKVPFEREHVTPYIRNHPDRFRLIGVNLKDNWRHLRVTVDEEEDLEVVETIMKRKGIDARLGDIIALAKEEPELFKLNLGAARRHDKHSARPDLVQ